MNAPPRGRIGLSEVIKIASDEGQVVVCETCDRALGTNGRCSTCDGEPPKQLGLAAKESVSPESWLPVDLAPVLAGDAVDEEPSWLPRDDGLLLLYAGKVHSFHGETESGKSWLAFSACQHVMDSGGLALYLDFEDTPTGVVSRFRALGVSDEEITKTLRYVQPDAPLPSGETLAALLASGPELAVVDGVTEAMVLHGLDPLSNRDVAKFMELLPRALAKTGATVLLIDHTVKSTESRSRFAIGAQHKLAGLDGAAYRFELVRPFGRGLSGLARIEVAKDRPGFVRGAAEGGVRVAELVIEPGEDGQVTVRLKAPQGWTLPIAAERVLEILRKADRELSTSQVQEATAHDGHPKPLRERTVQTRLNDLEAAGLVTGTEAPAGFARYWSAAALAG